MNQTPAPATITSVRNRRIVDARKLDQRKHRRRQNQFLVQDAPLLQMALDAGATPVNVFYCPGLCSDRRAAALLARFQTTPAQTYPVSPPVMHSLCTRDALPGIVATFELFEFEIDQLTIEGDQLVLLLDRLQDPGNVGTLIRTADAVGAAAVVLIEPCADPFDPKTVRGSMGSLFNIPIVRTNDLDTLFGFLERNRLRIVGADVRRGVEWGSGILQGRVALILGNEARGLSADVQANVHANACLPIPGQAESLNVAVAGGILMYTWLKANSGPGPGQDKKKRRRFAGGACKAKP